MQDDRVRLDGSGRSIFLPRRAQKDEWYVIGLDVHSDCAATRASDNDIGIVLIEFGLGEAHGFIKIAIRESGIEDFVALLFEKGRFAATGFRGPAMEEKDLHADAFIVSKLASA